MKTLHLIFLGILAAVCTPATWISAADLDSYYLERFGELKSPASEVYRTVQAAADSPVDRCYTPVYHALRHDWGKLAASTQQILAKRLARPVLTGAAAFTSADRHFTIHYATSGPDIPPAGDANNNGIPDWVETVADTFETVYAKEVGDMKYTAAPTAGNVPYDVYLQNVGSEGYLGYTASEAFLTTFSASSYIVLDNDFDGFAGYTAPQFLQITAAHEYHHAIQYGYNYYFDIWYAEATATWIEDEVFDSVNQLYSYLPAWFHNMGLSLNIPVNVYTGGGYGRWLFNRYIAEETGSGRDMVLTIWTSLAQKGATHDGSDIPMIPIIEENLGSPMVAILLDFGKKVALQNWTTHTGEISQIHPLLPQTGSSPLPLASFPAQPYSLAFFTYPLNTAGSADLSAKPASVLSGIVSPSSDILVLSSDGTTATPAPASVTSSGGGGGGGGGGGCFIATAAYGSYLHPKVLVLRGFRDRWLMTNPVGRLLVNGYYRVSPSMANVITRHGWMRRVCRILLSPLIATVEHPERVAPLLLGLLGWVLIRRRCGDAA